MPETTKQVDYTTVPVNAMPVEYLDDYPEEDRGKANNYIFKAWFHDKPWVAGYGSTIQDATTDLFRETRQLIDPEYLARGIK